MPQRSSNPGPGTPAGALTAAGVKPARQRGQNFLVQKTIAERIVELAEIAAHDRVIEIGPGLGMLSECILERAPARLQLIELDRVLAQRLREALEERCELIEGDFLQLDFAALTAGQQVKVLGNLPFNVAGAILKKLCDHRGSIARMVLMFQREVGERIRARPGDDAFGALSLLVALDWEIGAHFRVHAGSFHPRPKIDAEVLCFRPALRTDVSGAMRERLATTIRAGFATRRKLLSNALAAGLQLPRTAIEAAMERAAIAPSARAEELAMEDFVRLSTMLSATLSPLPESRDA